MAESTQPAGDDKRPVNWINDDKWVHEQFESYPICKLYPNLRVKVEEVLVRWLAKFDKKIIHRMFKANKIFKEFNESAPFLQHILDLVESYTGPKLTLFDLCSGLGFVGCFLSEILDPEKVGNIYLIDKMFPMHGCESTNTQINIDHIRKYEWPIEIQCRKRNIKKTREQREITTLLESRPGPVILCAVHLCGTLSLQAINMYNSSNKYICLLLKPCCLPGKVHVYQKQEYVIGPHKFTARQLYKEPKWRGKFQFWNDNLMQCIAIDNKNLQDIPVSLSKVHPQNKFIFAARSAEDETEQSGKDWEMKIFSNCTKYQKPVTNPPNTQENSKLDA